MFYTKEYITNNIILIIILSFTFLLCLILFISNFSKIKNVLKFLSGLLKIIINIIKEPIIFILTHFKFYIKKFILEYKLTFCLKNRNNRLLCDVLFNLFLLFIFALIVLYVLSNANDKYNNILLMLDGAIISIWITHYMGIVNSIRSYAKNLNRIFATLSTMLQVLSSLYELFVGFFPYNDNLFKKGGDIIYVTPYGHGNGVVLQKESAILFLNYFQTLTQEQLIDSYNESNARVLITYLMNQRESIRTAYSFMIANSDYIPKYIIDLFEQVFSLVDKIVTFHQMYKNLDLQLKMQSSALYSTYIYKLAVTIITLQDEQLFYKEYITHISNPPKLIFAKTLDDVINLNKKLKH